MPRRRDWQYHTPGDRNHTGTATGSWPEVSGVGMDPGPCASGLCAARATGLSVAGRAVDSLGIDHTVTEDVPEDGKLVFLELNYRGGVVGTIARAGDTMVDHVTIVSLFLCITLSAR